MTNASPANPPDFKVAIDVVRQLLAFAREQGLDIDAAVRHHNIKIEPLPGDPAFMSGPEVERMLAIGLRALTDPLPGLYAAKGHVATLFGLAGFLVQTCSTVRSLLRTLIQVEPLVGNGGITQLRQEPGEVHLLWDCLFKDPYVRYHTADFIFYAYVAGILSASEPGPELIRAVQFCHSPPDDPALIERYVEMFCCPVYFDQPQNRIIIPASIMDLPLTGADPQLHEALKVHALKVLDERNRTNTFADHVRSQLHQLLHRGDASRENLAAALNMSGRTLHRKLGDVGTSYRDLLDELRLERARTLLRNSTLSVQQVAEQIGFDEHNSFTRWFRQMTGIAPSEFRLGIVEGND